MRITRLGIGLVAAGLLLTACGGGDDPSTSEAPVTSEAEPQAAEVAVDEEPEPAGDVQLSADGLRGALLTLNDMPEAGYTTSPIDDDRERKTYCNYDPPSQPNTSVASEFEKSEGLSAYLVRSTIDQYDSADDAAAQLAKMSEILQDCTEEDVDGTLMTYSVMSAPSVGDGSVGVKIEMTDDDIDYVMHQIYIQSDAAIIQTSDIAGGLAFPNAEQISELAKLSVERHQAAIN